METKIYAEWLKDEEIDNEFGKFERITNPRSKNPDLNAFILLESLGLTVANDDIITGSEHDEFFLNVNTDFKFTKEQAIELHRCGILYNNEFDSFYKFT